MSQKIEIRLSRKQGEFVQTFQPYPLFVGGYGSGKSHAAICRLLAKKLQYPHLNVAYYLPTYDLISTIGFPRFADMLGRMKIPYILNKSDKVMQIGNGQVIFRTMDNPERIIGYEVADSCLDELDTLPTDKARNVWHKAMARNRQTKQDGAANTIGVVTTPEGFRFVHEMWVKSKKPGYQVIRASTDSNAKHLPAGYIDSLRAIYPGPLLDAYINGEFVNLTSGTVYRDFDRIRCDSTETIRPMEPLYIGQDFNVGAMFSCVFVRRPDCLHMVEEIAGVYDTPELCRVLKERYPDRQIYIYPDASGKSRKTVDATTSDITLLQDAGFVVRANKANPAVKDRINAVNICFAKGIAWVNTTQCPHVTAALEQQAYAANGEPDKSSGVDHAVDAMGYVLAYEYPVRRPVIDVPINFMA